MTKLQLRPEDRRADLPDGRKLGYAEYGDPGGAPVIYCHGALSCRLDAAFASDQCREMGVRLIAVDRPGIGISDAQPGRKLLDWAEDVKDLADFLGLDKFGILGWSGGGPHAIVVAYKYPQRLTGAATIGSAAPLVSPLHVSDMSSWADRFFMHTSKRAPWLGCALLSIAAHETPEMFKKDLLHEVTSAADRSVIEKMEASEASEFFFQAMKPGVRGAVDDYRVFAEPWGFELEEITFPITFFYGDEDPFLPRAHADFMATHTPNSKLVVIPGRGHFLLHQELATVLSASLGFDLSRKVGERI